MDLIRGANALLASQEHVSVEISPGQGAGAIELACFLVDASGKTPGPGAVVCPSQSHDTNNAVRMTHPSGETSFSVDINKIPSNIQKCVVVASLAAGSFRHVTGMVVTARCSGQDLRYQLVDTGDERAMILAELYRHASGWKFRAVGQGVTGDAKDLAQKFGAVLPAPPPRPSSGPPAPLPSTDKSASNPVRLGKIILDKPTASATLSLAKGPGGPPTIKVRMTWHSGVDLDLHAFYRLKDGRTGHVYFGDKGSLKASPWIALDQDAAVDRRAGDHEEILTIAKIDAVQAVLFAANIFTLGGLLGFGNENFARYDGVVTVSTGDQDIVAALASTEPGRWAVIARLDNDRIPRVTRIDRVIKQQPTLADFPGSS
jgi:tellurite resistance protein TerA